MIRGGGGGGSAAYGRLPTGDYEEEDKAQIQKTLKRQDESLDILGTSVQRLGELSLNISREIDTQNRMLDRIEEDVDKAQSSANSLISKTKELIKKSGYIIVFILLVIFIFK